MDFARAQEILNSPETFEVLYQGLPVWIEYLNSANQTALVTSDFLPGGSSTVPVEQLVEEGKAMLH
ncbi:H-type small acid-soluble spore protein [Zhaonella formicivorans]|jgi:small acid-soluble spore protein H (minor)|uniref:H-type small acid-soluble spore protein n=1 Tax=Zhaonella formicivorans TaxID=2528593 RepID=UPI0010D5ECC7|nr:H-type small acid-soluble spore protein [Zhaonella formicivorans]